MNIEKHFLEKSLALKVKQLGFNEPCLMYWDNKGDLKPHNPPHYYKNGVFVSTPMIDQVLDWCGEKYNTHGCIEIYEQGWAYSIVRGEYEFFSGANYATRSEALNKLLEDLLLKVNELIIQN
jgi:hypothetical protein